MMGDRSALVVKVDGIDGCGKTTLVEKLYGVYKDRLRVTTTREFGSAEDYQVIRNKQGGTVSRVLYEMSLNPRLVFDDIETQLVMAVASRRQNRLVLHRLRQNYDLILSDRSSLTSLAYGYELGSAFRHFLKWAIEPVLEEDMVLWIDIDPQVSFKRRTQNRDFELEEFQVDAVEQRGLAFQIAVAEQFTQFAKQRSNVVRLDGALDLEALLSVAKAHVDGLLTSRQLLQGSSRKSE